MYCIEGEGWFETDGIRQKVLTHHFLLFLKVKLMLMAAIV